MKKLFVGLIILLVAAGVAFGDRISQWAHQTGTIASGDLIPTTDVSDTTQSAQGTSKYSTFAELEGDLTLSNLGGAVTDAQVPDDITISNFDYDGSDEKWTVTGDLEVSGAVSAGSYFSGSGINLTNINDDSVVFDDVNGDWTATAIGPALEELVTEINSGTPNSATAKVHWSQLTGVPAGFADGADATGAGGSAIILDLADDDSNESTDLAEVAVSNDTNSIFSEPAADKVLIDVSQNWPTADTANAGDSATSFFSTGTIEAARLPSTLQAISGITGNTNDMIYHNGSTWTDLTPAALMAILDDLTWDFANQVTFSNGYTVDPSTTPTSEFEDSDAPGTDKESAKIYSNYIDGADGSENHDMFFQIKQGGTYTTFMQMDESDDQVEFAKNTDLQDNDVAAGEIADFYAYDTIPIAWMKDGTSAPAALDDASTRSPYAYRAFDSASDEDLNFIWFVPPDFSGTTFQYRVYYLIPNATGPSATEGVAFSLAGISAGDNDATNGTKGTAVTVTDDALDASQWDVMVTPWSGDVSFSNIAAGEIAEGNFERTTADAIDDYLQDVGPFAVQIRWVKNPAR